MLSYVELLSERVIIPISIILIKNNPFLLPEYNKHFYHSSGDSGSVDGLRIKSMQNRKNSEWGTEKEAIYGYVVACRRYLGKRTNSRKIPWIDRVEPEDDFLEDVVNGNNRKKGR